MWYFFHKLQRPLRRVCSAGFFLNIVLLAFRFAAADIRDSFESAEPSWRLAESDCGARLVIQERTARTAHSGTSSEFLRLVAGHGTQALVVQSIPPARCIAELSVGVWVKADRPGIQLLARVQFPRSAHPRTGRPIAVWIRGSIYDKVDGWQFLSLPKPSHLVRQQATILNGQLKTDIDLRETYVDLVTLNAYGGVGTTNLWIDDLEVVGHVPLDERTLNETRATIAVPLSRWPKTNVVKPASFVTSASSSAAVSPAWEGNKSPLVETQGSLLLVQGRPFMPRAIAYQGESFEWLQSLGFNTIKLATPPTDEQMLRARNLNLWLIAPPPAVNDEIVDAAASRVLVWNVGDQATASHAAALLATANRLQKAPPNLLRPVMIGASGGEALLSRHADITRLDPVTPGQEIASGDFGALRARAAQTRPATPLWMTVLATAGDSLQRAVYDGISAGSRGFFFDAAQPLDQTLANNPSLIHRIQTINRELALIEPWVAAGTGAEPLYSEDRRWRLHVLPLERSRLIVALRTNDDPPPLSRDGLPISRTVATRLRRSLSLIDPGARSSFEPFQITPQGLQPLRHSRTAGGTKIDLTTDDDAALVIVAQDAVALERMNRMLTADNSPRATK